MKKLILFIFAGTLIASCGNKEECSKNEHKAEETTAIVKQEEKHEDVILAGKNLEYNYGDAVYQLNFNSDSELHWKCVKGDEEGKEADEKYVTQKLNGYTYFISWVEADGLGVSQVVDFKKNTVNCYLKIEKEIVSLSGTIKTL